jgi:hypothetical protein
MKPIPEKVKDIVDVRSSGQVEDFIADLAQTLSGYFFTDITSDLMAKWIDRVVVMPTGSGNAYALAGYRGVGKSHFLAAFGAILSQPELRAKLNDSHVFASAERLIRRHYPVIYIRRGTKPTLLEELQDGVARAFETSSDSVGSKPTEIVAFVSEKSGAGPAVLIIDTDIEREARVTRDDGSFLSEIAECAEGTNVFVAVALDDDVATADGRNSGISRSFQIDYLDHEHLYKIIDAHIFPKKNQKREVLSTLFENFRSVLPSFRWSEQRMSSVYPVHPVILEVAPFVRLFVQDFALLAFASEAGSKILNRPADSLIALDGLFDTVEKSLRKSNDLADVFEAYDSLNDSVVNKVPVLERLKAKLVLKGLLLLSLDSEGATASDIAASMLIFDERDTRASVVWIEGLLERLVEASNGRLWRMEREGRAVKYGFNLSGKEHFNTALAEAVQNVPDSVVPALLKRLMHDRFSDCEFEAGGGSYEVASTVIEWRGGVRKGRVLWNIGNHGEMPEQQINHPTNWEILIDFEPVEGTPGERAPFIQWKPDELKPEEFDALKRYHALMSRGDLQQVFRDEVRTAIQTYTIAIEKIWERKFLQYGALVIDGTERKFNPEALAGHNLSEVLGVMLSSHLEAQFPEHPILGSRLEMSAVDQLATGLFAAREGISPEVRRLAEHFAVPLGLAEFNGPDIEVRPVESLLAIYSVSALMEMLATADDAVKMESLQTRLGARPFGLTFEAQCLILTALVARGVVEFVTKNGDRIGSRSLDLQLVWDDVAGIAMPAHAKVSNDGLALWASLLTGRDKFKSITSESAKREITEALSEWLLTWNNRNLLATLENIPDDMVTTRLWHLGARVKKTFGIAAEAIGSITSGSVDLEPGLRRVEDAFSGSEVEFLARSADVEALESVLRVVPLREEIKNHIGFFETSETSAVEQDRAVILGALGNGAAIDSIVASGRLSLNWSEFQKNFNEDFEMRHVASSRTHEIRDRANEILATHEWWIFENLADVEQFPTRFRRITKEILRELRRCNCTASANTAEYVPPYCAVCGYSLRSDRNRSLLCGRLWDTINQAIVAYDHVLQRIKDDVIEGAEKFAKSNKSGDGADAAKGLLKKLKDGVSVAALDGNELRAMLLVFKRLNAPSAEPLIEESITPVVTAEEIIEDAVVMH